MADAKISELTELTTGQLAPTADVVAVVDTSAGQTKKITAQNLMIDAGAATTGKAIAMAIVFGG